jgi:predicted RNA-binding protein with PUA-like domain
MRQVRKGDKVLCYHGSPDRLVYAMAEAASDAYPNPQDETGKQLIVNLRAVQKLPRSVPLVELRTNRRLRRMKFLTKTRLAVTPLAEEEYAEILRMSGYVPPLGLSLLS